jgi:DNA repair exonuclease SbcCD ATPase subunit
MPLDTLSVYRGENGAGKSSVEQAFQMLLSGRSESTDDKGSGSRDLIRRGSDKCAITVEITDKALLGDRTAKMRCSITEKSGRTVIIKDPADESWTGADFLSTLAMKREILDCLCNGRYFIDMDDARQKKLLAGIILPTSVTWDDWVEGAVNDCSLTVDWSFKAFDVIRMAYDAAYEERKQINRRIKDWKEPEPVPVQEMDAQAIRARLAERQAERTKLAISRNEAIGKWARANDARKKAQDKIQALEFKLSTEQTRRTEIAKGLLSAKALKEAEKLAANAERGKTIEQEIQKNAGALAEVRRSLTKLNLLGDAGICPTCTQPISDAEFERITVPLIKQQDSLIDQERSLQADRKALGDYDGAQKVLADHAQAEKNLKLVDEHIAGIEKDVAELAAEIDGNQETAQPDTTKIDLAIADLDGRIEKGNAALNGAIWAETGRKAYMDAMEAKKKLDAKQGTLERLVEYFGPKGIQAKLLDEHVGGFEGSMNKVLATWGYQAHLQFEPYQFGLSFSGKDAVFNLRTISKSQRHAFSIAFQVALAKVSGFNFVLVDEAELFLDANRGQMYRALMGAGLDQVIVLQSDLRREIPKAPNSVFYILSLDKSGDVPATKVERLT